MPRQARKESSTGYYHVMMRGINREYIFQQDADKLTFIEFVQEQQDKGLLSLAAWCIMDNHVHMIIKTELSSLSKAIKVISLKFAAFYNSSQSRLGPVFGDRFRSESIEDESYLLGALRYIHWNPLKAQLVSDLSNYQWSSYKEYATRAKYISSEQRLFILGLFGDSLKSFSLFHSEEDNIQYLETSEDADALRQDLAQKVIKTSCQEHGLASPREVQERPEIFTTLCRKLVQDIGLTLRKAAQYLETTQSRVYRALQDNATE